MIDKLIKLLKLLRWISEEFYGDLLIKFQKGKIVHVERKESLNLNK
jgi:hypothetical protein